VLAFVSLRELAAALAVNHEWSAAVLSLRADAVPVKISGAADGLLSSRLRRHVVEIGQWGNTKQSLLSNQLGPLSRAVPGLRSLSTRLRLLAGPLALPFPPQLHRLNVLLFHSPSDSRDSATALLSSIGQLQQLHTLRLELPQGVVSLVPLQQLSNLRDLELLASFSNGKQYAAELHALPWLHRLHVARPSSSNQAPISSLFHALLRDAAEEEVRALQWRDFDCSLFFDDKLTPLLLRLPLTEHLHPL